MWYERVMCREGIIYCKHRYREEIMNEITLTLRRIVSEIDFELMRKNVKCAYT